MGGENAGVDPVPTTRHLTRRSAWSCGAAGGGFVAAGAMVLLLAVAVARPAVGESVEGSSELRVLDDPAQDLYLSDHIGLLARVALPRAR